MTRIGTGEIVGIGVDAVEVDRLRRMLVRRPALIDRLFTSGEQSYAARAGDPAERFASRFAAKEATMKVLGGGIGTFRFADIEVVRPDLGAPHLEVHGAAAEAAERAGIGGWHLSLTHTDRTAIAFVVADRGHSSLPSHPPGSATPGSATPGSATRRAGAPAT